MKTLIVTPELNRSGGVACFYKMLSPYFSKDDYVFFFIGGSGTIVSKVIHRLLDPLFFATKLLSSRGVKTVLLNPSLGNRAFVRDCILAGISLFLQKRVAVFMHGWDVSFERQIDNSVFLKFLYRKTLGKAFVTFTLCSAFSRKLKQWGATGKHVLSSTCIDDKIFEATIRTDEEEKQNDLGPYRFLFLSRMEPDKGPEIVLKAFALLQKKYKDNVELILAGDGSARVSLEEYARANHIPGVSFPGYVSGEKKVSTLKEAHCFCFPSTHGEGMPCSLLEAMGAGLTILTSSAGGVADFFMSPEMGVLNNDLTIETFSTLMENAYLSWLQKRGHNSFNREYAGTHFLASACAKFISQHINTADECAGC